MIFLIALVLTSNTSNISRVQTVNSWFRQYKTLTCNLAFQVNSISGFNCKKLEHSPGFYLLLIYWYDNKLQPTRELSGIWTTHTKGWENSIAVCEYLRKRLYHFEEKRVKNDFRREPSYKNPTPVTLSKLNKTKPVKIQTKINNWMAFKKNWIANDNPINKNHYCWK